MTNQNKKEKWESASYWQKKLKIDYIAAVKIIEEISQTRKQAQMEILERIELNKMDYLKWQLRTDLTDEKFKTGGNHLEEYTNKARGWNKLRQKIKSQIEKLKEEL